jgi:metal-sulfur cluster biosynthetic enzyme
MHSCLQVVSQCSNCIQVNQCRPLGASPVACIGSSDEKLCPLFTDNLCITCLLDDLSPRLGTLQNLHKQDIISVSTVEETESVRQWAESTTSTINPWKAELIPRRPAAISQMISTLRRPTIPATVLPKLSETLQDKGVKESSIAEDSEAEHSLPGLSKICDMTLSIKQSKESFIKQHSTVQDLQVELEATTELTIEMMQRAREFEDFTEQRRKDSAEEKLDLLFGTVKDYFVARELEFKTRELEHKTRELELKQNKIEKQVVEEELLQKTNARNLEVQRKTSLRKKVKGLEQALKVAEGVNKKQEETIKLQAEEQKVIEQKLKTVTEGKGIVDIKMKQMIKDAKDKIPALDILQSKFEVKEVALATTTQQLQMTTKANDSLTKDLTKMTTAKTSAEEEVKGLKRKLSSANLQKQKLNAKEKEVEDLNEQLRLLRLVHLETIASNEAKDREIDEHVQLIDDMTQKQEANARKIEADSQMIDHLKSRL